MVAAGTGCRTGAGLVAGVGFAELVRLLCGVFLVLTTAGLFVAAGANMIEHSVIGGLVCRKSDQGRQIRNLREIVHVSSAHA